MITRESPAIQSRSFFFGVNFCLAGGFATTGLVVGVFVVVVGFGVTRLGGMTIATSMSSAWFRPIASWTRLRGRSSRSAWLTSASPPVSASDTSRLVPGWPLKAALCIPGASSSAPKTRPSSATISPCPAVE